MTSLPPSRLLAIALAPRTTEDALAALQTVAHLADAAELRLDLMAEFDLSRLLANRPCPVVVTYRPEREGGRYVGPEDERLAVLRRAMDLGADYIDVEWDAIGRIEARGRTRLIVSSHDFAGMPPDIGARWRELRGVGADVVKVVGTARDALDAAAILRTLAQADTPTVAIAMGEAGLATRVLALKYDACLLTYCALPSGAGTAPGQVTVTDMLEVYRARAIRGDTAIYGLIGPRTDRARTREHNAWLRARALDAVAVPLLVPPDGDPARTIAAFRALGARGFHVDPPHQQEAARAVDDLDSSAIRAGKVDTVYWRAGALVGAWAGSPVEQLALWRG